MKKLILVFTAVLLTSFSGMAQPRLKKPFATVGKKVVASWNGMIGEVMGWSTSEEGQWISARCRMVLHWPMSRKDLNGIGPQEPGIDNFLKVELRNMNYKDSNYLLIMKSVRTGFYKVSGLSKEWINGYAIRYFVLPSNCLKDSIELKADTQTLIKLPVVCYGEQEYDKIDLHRLGEHIAATMDKASTPSGEKEVQSLVFNTYYLPGKDAVRFLFFGEDKLGSDTNYYGLSAITEVKPDMDAISTAAVFKDNYYECTLKTFRRILPVKVVGK